MKSFCLVLLAGMAQLPAQTAPSPSDPASSSVPGAPPTAADNAAVAAAPAATSSSLDEPLYKAAAAGDLARVTSFLNEGANINNQAGWHGYTPLLAATAYKRWDVVRFLLSKKADPNLGAVTGTHPLGFACQDGQFDIVHALLEAGENPNLCDPNYLLPIVYVARSGRVDVMKDFIAHGADVNLNGVDGPALYHAVGYDRLPIVQLLLDSGARIDIPPAVGTQLYEEDPDRPSMSLLGLAARANDLPMIDLLVAHGVALNSPGANGETPLTDAIMWSRKETILHLLDQKVDPSLPDSRDETPS